MADFFTDLLGGLAKGLPQVTQVLEGRKAEKKAQDRSAALNQANRTQTDIASLEKRADALAKTNPDMATALTARANELRGTLTLAETDPAAFLQNVGQINAKPITGSFAVGDVSSGTAAALLGDSTANAPMDATQSAIGANGSATGNAGQIKGDPTAGTVGTTYTQGAISTAVTAAGDARDATVSSRQATLQLAGDILKNPNGYSPEAVAGAREYLKNPLTADSSSFVGAAKTQVTSLIEEAIKIAKDPNVDQATRDKAQAYVTSNGTSGDTSWLSSSTNVNSQAVLANLTTQPRTAFAIVQQLKAAGKPTGLTPDQEAALEKRVANLDKSEQLGLDQQGISVRLGLINLETNTWDLGKSQQAWELTKTKDARTARNEQQALINEWMQGGNIEALQGLTDADFAALQMNREGVLARATQRRTEIDKGTSNTLQAGTLQNTLTELSIQTVQDALTTNRTKAKTDQADLFNKWEAEGQASALESSRADMRALGWTDAMIDDRIAQAKANRDLQTRAKEANVTVAEAQATIQTLEASSRTALQGVTEGAARGDALAKITAQGTLGVSVLDNLLKDNTITQAEHDKAVKEANATQTSKDIERFARDNQNQALGEQATEATRRVMIANGAADAGDINTIAKLGNAGVSILTRLFNAGYITQTQLDNAKDDAKGYERDVVLARSERDLEGANKQVAQWAGLSTQITDLMKSPQWATTKAALGMNDAQLTAYIKQQRTDGVREKDYVQQQRNKKDAQTQLDTWAAVGQDLSKVDPALLEKTLKALGLTRDAAVAFIKQGDDKRASDKALDAARLAAQNLSNKSTAQQIDTSYQTFQLNIKTVTQNLELNRAKVEAEIARIKSQTAGTPQYEANKNSTIKTINTAADGYRKTAATYRAQATAMRASITASPAQKAQADALDAQAAELEATSQSLYSQAAQLSGAVVPGALGGPATPPPPATGTGTGVTQPNGTNSPNTPAVPAVTSQPATGNIVPSAQPAGKPGTVTGYVFTNAQGQALAIPTSTQNQLQLFVSTQKTASGWKSDADVASSAKDAANRIAQATGLSLADAYALIIAYYNANKK